MMHAIFAGLLGVTVLAGSALASTGCPSGLAANSEAATAMPPPGSGAAGQSRAYAGKPRPPLEVTLVPGAGLESGVPGQLVLQIRSRVPLEDVRLTVEGDAGLVVTGPPRELDTTDGEGRSLAAEEPARFEVPATPNSGGSRRVSGLVTYRIGGVVQAAPFSLGLKVAGPDTLAAVARKPEKMLVQDHTGELIDSMPAETTVR